MALKEKKFLTRDHYVHYYYETSLFTSQSYARWNTDYDGRYRCHYEFIPPVEIRGRYSHGSSNVTNHLSPRLSKIDPLVEQLENLLDQNNSDGIASLLNSDFILQKVRKIEENGIHTDRPSEVQGHYYTYQICLVRPNIEQLILKHNEAFRRLLFKAEVLDIKYQNNINKGLRNAIVQQLKDLDLEDIDLGGLNLANADLSRSKFKNVRFTNSTFTDAVCINSDLLETNISKKQISDCKTYLDAKLSIDFWPYWTETTKNNVLNGLTNLKKYGNKLIAKGIDRGTEAVKLADQLIESINDPSTKYNEAFQRKFLKELHSKDKLFENHRGYKRIIANITLCVVSGFIGYLVAGLINIKLTGNFTFFSKTTSREKVESIDSVLKRPANSMNVFNMSQHARAGKNSNIHKFFGHTKSVPNHPLGDPKVLANVAKFLS